MFSGAMTSRVGVKTAWLIVVIILPFLGVFIYLISQNKGMRERGRVREATREATRGYYGQRQRRGGDRVRKEAARQRRDHAGRVQRNQAEGAGVASATRDSHGCAVGYDTSRLGP